MYEKILFLLKNNKEINQILLQEPKEKVFRLLFHNYRQTDGGRGLKLTPYGFDCVVKVLEAWEFKVELKTKHFLLLEKKQKAPYYYDTRNKILYIFDSELAMRLKLADGDLEFCL